MLIWYCKASALDLFDSNAMRIFTIHYSHIYMMKHYRKKNEFYLSVYHISMITLKITKLCRRGEYTTFSFSFLIIIIVKSTAKNSLHKQYWLLSSSVIHLDLKLLSDNSVFCVGVCLLWKIVYVHLLNRLFVVAVVVGLSLLWSFFFTCFQIESHLVSENNNQHVYVDKVCLLLHIEINRRREEKWNKIKKLENIHPYTQFNWTKCSLNKDWKIILTICSMQVALDEWKKYIFISPSIFDMNKTEKSSVHFFVCHWNLMFRLLFHGTVNLFFSTLSSSCWHFLSLRLFVFISQDMF